MSYLYNTIRISYIRNSYYEMQILAGGKLENVLLKKKFDFQGLRKF